MVVTLVCLVGARCFNHDKPHGLWRQSVATAAYRVLETETTVLAWLAACWWAWAVCLRLSQGARK